MKLPPFEATSALESDIARAAALIHEASSVVALTGAGISVESGIPPFRGPGGLWTKYGEPPMDGFQRFLRDPVSAWRERLQPTEGWAKGLHHTLEAAKPNPGHLALAALGHAGYCDALITQNVDDLHQQAEQPQLIEIHGNHYWLRCIDCHHRFDPDHFHIDEDQLPPLCSACGGLVKGDTVSFGEPIPPQILHACYASIESCDLMLVVGTSATVYPAADFPMEVLRRGGEVVEINLYPSELTDYCLISLQGPSSLILTRLLSLLRPSNTHIA